MHMRANIALYGIASTLLMLLAGLFQQPLTASMALHMLVHIPMILVSGMLAECVLYARGQARQYRSYNEYGVPGLLLATFASAYWMIPKALDDVLTSVPLNILKFAGLFLVGMILMDSLRQANRVIILFFLGSFSWMAAVIGLVYQDSTTRLCNFYLLSDQEIAGKGLVFLAIALPVYWLLSEIKPIWHFLKR